ncbi:hypothetical protein GCM10008171_01640 [Methylopila jiangsuensis]|uniref:DNA primase/polymerase bifunctional N-terminal domain-containing protein n=1 Tax=Methylopila jiangsuensis TaxID=586230 RepID=A0A9W6JCC4_9HYPH|nr:bifunctional DNA primase/polymerase [Methylopila jiangsuensis]MDR6287331.1 hypothetical protein [Methylopila jiangsuensis]GLK74911.1 hypothetical protein GCM10008171_01640 [Methylopila jiangsuensis]
MDLREYFAQRFEETGEEFVVTSEQFGESFFQIYAPELHKRDWSVYPQERTGRRMPARIEGEVIAWSKYQTERPADELMNKWCWHASTHNVAAIMGPSSGNAIAIDVDVTDERLSVEIENLITRTLGHTDYRRIGNAPKIMLFYRLDREASFNKRSHVLSKDGDPAVASEHMVEILAKASTVTFYGRHHSSGSRFQWLEHPCQISPMELPVTTEEELGKFERKLAELNLIFNPPAKHYTLGLTAISSKTGTKVVPDLPATTKDWYEDPRSNLITDGREKFLTKLVWETVRANDSQRYSDNDYAELARIVFDAFCAKAERSGRWTDGFLLREISMRLARVCPMMERGEMTANSRVRRDRSGGVEILPPPPPAPEKTGGVFDRMEGSRLAGLIGPAKFEPRYNTKTGEAQFTYPKKEAVDVLKDMAARALPVDRRKIHTDVAAASITAARYLMAAIEAHRREKELASEGVELQGPSAAEHMEALCLMPGSGKTTGVVSELTSIMQAPARKLPASERLIFSVKTHRLMHEAAEKATKAGRRAMIEGLPGVEILTADSPIPTGPSDKVRIGLAEGKSRCKTCHYAKEFQRLADVGMSSVALCEQDDETAPGGKRRCDVWARGECTFKNQEAIFAHCQILLVVAPYLTLPSTPRWMKQGCVALIVDEDPTLGLAREYTAKIEDLLEIRDGRVTDELKKELGWRKPRKGEKPARSPINEVGVAELRRALWRMVIDALEAGRDPAAMLVDYRDQDRVSGRAYVLAAKACVSRAHNGESKLRPNMPIEELRAMLDSRPKQTAGVTAERQLISVILDRMDQIAKDRIARELWKVDLVRAENHVALARDIPAAEMMDYKEKVETVRSFEPRAGARGTVDARLQLRDPNGAQFWAKRNWDAAEAQKAATKPGHRPRAYTGPRYTHLRISKRLKMNFGSVPTLLLDASANIQLVEKAFGRKVRPITVDAIPHQVVAACFDRSYSDYQLIPRAEDTPAQIAAKEANVARLRLNITMAADFGAPGRVLFITTKKAQPIIRQAWLAPSNADWMYFGDVRGRDGAKDHAGVVIIGRSQFPISTDDAIGAAFSYDSDEPEQPFDRFGTGLEFDDKGEPVELFRRKTDRVVHLRNGHDVIRQVPEMPAGFGRFVDQGWRDEEIIQGVGRPRNVYRHGDTPPPFVLYLGSALPSSVIVDEIFHDADMVKHAGPAEARRIAGEITSAQAPIDAEDDAIEPAAQLMIEQRVAELRAKEKADKKVAIPTKAIIEKAKKELFAEWRLQAYRHVPDLDPTVFSHLADDAAIKRITGYPAEELDRIAIEASQAAADDAVEPLVLEMGAQCETGGTSEAEVAKPTVIATWIDGPSIAPCEIPLDDDQLQEIAAEWTG